LHHCNKQCNVEPTPNPTDTTKDIPTSNLATINNADIISTTKSSTSSSSHTNPSTTSDSVTTSFTPTPTQVPTKELGRRPKRTTEDMQLLIKNCVTSAKAEITHLYKAELIKSKELGQTRVRKGIYQKIHDQVTLSCTPTTASRNNCREKQ
jgi:ABC-type antimicrobial peptide transport system permease subunit